MEIETSGGASRAYLDGDARGARFLLALTHGAGGGVEPPDLLAARDAGVNLGGVVARVLQPYRVRGARAPGAADKQDAAWLEIAAALRAAVPAGLPYVQGGRSNGARVACRTALAAGAQGVVALAFPLCPPGKPQHSRIAELRGCGVPALVISGERDPFGIPEAGDADEVVVVPGETHALRGHAKIISAAIERWLPAVLGGLMPGQAAGARPVAFLGEIRWRSSVRSVGRCGAIRAPSGSSSPVSSKITIPLQSRLHPCSGWLTMVCAASRSGADGAGHGGVCGHISVPPGRFIILVRFQL